MKKIWFLIQILLLSLAIILFLNPLQIQAKVDNFLNGNPEDVSFKSNGAVYNLGGGGPDVDSAIQWMINQVRGCKTCAQTVDVVVIRVNASQGYNQPILEMNGVDSIETLVIPERIDLQNSQTIKSVKNAEVIFFAGGDQCQYVRNFQDTEVTQAVKSVVAKRGAVGGTSAGAMIQSDFVFNACSETVVSATALSDPYKDIELTERLFEWEILKNTIIDTHFSERDRMGRLMTFIARLLQDGEANQILGIGIDEGTSILINQQGIAEVTGEGNAYFILGDHQPEICQPQTPLTFSNYQIWKVSDGEFFDLSNYPTTIYKQVSVENGEILSNPY
ncbi:MAG: Type 1 glutamine amidotransferase-like domain-containing protein [Cyanobacteriota bacterium]|nr:Type 1 glutamine amidotransferase-like domain-containing protein [Cyanobacteriota bacterium]